MKRSTLLLLVVLLLCSVTWAQVMKGHGAPNVNTPNSADSRFYIDESTGKLYMSVQGSPPKWVDVDNPEFSSLAVGATVSANGNIYQNGLLFSASPSTGLPYLRWVLADNAANTVVAANDASVNGVLNGANTSAVSATVNGYPAFHFQNGEYITLTYPRIQAAALKNLWLKAAANPVLINVGNKRAQFGQLVHNQNGGWYWFGSNALDIYRWESPDLVHWGNMTLVLAHAPDGSWDSRLQVASVFQKLSDGSWVMLYRGSDVTGTTFQMGLATSSDGSLPFSRKNNGGVNDGLWNPFSTNFDPTTVMAVPRVASTGGYRYYVYTNGRTSHGYQNVYYSDDDFATFTGAANNPIFNVANVGNDAGFYCATAWRINNVYYMLVPVDTIGTATADNSLYAHGLALWSSTDPTFPAKARAFLGYAAVNDQPYDDAYLDTPSIPTLDVTRSTFPLEFGSTLNALYTSLSSQVALGTTESLIQTTYNGLASLPQVADLHMMLLDNKLTFDFWIQFDQLNDGDPVLSVGATAADGSPRWLMNIQTSGANKVLGVFLGGAYQKTTAALTTGTPYHVMLRSDTVNTYVYVNDTLAGTFAQAVTKNTSIANVYIGSGYPSSKHLHGYVWDFRIYP